MPHLSPLPWGMLLFMVVFSVSCMVIFYYYVLWIEFKYSGKSLAGVKEREWGW